MNVDWIRLDWIHLPRVFRIVFCRGGFFFVEKNISGCYFFFGREGFWDFFQRIEWKKGKKKRVEQQKQNTFQIVYIFPYPPHSIRIPKVGYIRYIGLFFCFIRWTHTHTHTLSRTNNKNEC